MTGYEMAVECRKRFCPCLVLYLGLGLTERQNLRPKSEPELLFLAWDNDSPVMAQRNELPGTQCLHSLPFPLLGALFHLVLLTLEFFFTLTLTPEVGWYGPDKYLSIINLVWLIYYFGYPFAFCPYLELCLSPNPRNGLNLNLWPPGMTQRSWVKSLYSQLLFWQPFLIPQQSGLFFQGNEQTGWVIIQPSLHHVPKNKCIAKGRGEMPFLQADSAWQADGFYAGLYWGLL